MTALALLHDRLANLAASVDTTTEEGRREAARIEELRAATVHLEAASEGDPLTIASKLLSWLDYYTAPPREPEVRSAEGVVETRAVKGARRDPQAPRSR
jgi:hypothetical protein